MLTLDYDGNFLYRDLCILLVSGAARLLLNEWRRMGYYSHMEKVTRVGIGVFIFKDGAFLMGQRRNAHGDGTWSLPGGHLEFGETFEETAQREVLEETGLTITNIRFGAVTNDHFKSEDKHYVTVWMLSDWQSGTEQILEPDKCTALEWRTFNDLPEPLFLPWQQLFDSPFIDAIEDELTKSRQ